MTTLRVRGPSLPDSALSASAPGDFRPVFHFFNVGAIARGEPDEFLARRSTRDRPLRRSHHRRCPFARARTSFTPVRVLVVRRRSSSSSSSSRARVPSPDARARVLDDTSHTGVFTREYDARARARTRVFSRANTTHARPPRIRAYRTPSLTHSPPRPRARDRARARARAASRVRARVLSPKLRPDRERVRSCEPHTSKHSLNVRYEIRRRVSVGARDDAMTRADAMTREGAIGAGVVVDGLTR